jgi:hypothetical protein
VRIEVQNIHDILDLDSQALDLDKELNQTLANIKSKFENNDTEPKVLWSGNGYHIYLPVDALVLEDESLFQDIEVYDPSRKFLQWIEQHLSNNKADPCHSMGVSFNNCMLRIPGSMNSKVNRQVTILQHWNRIDTIRVSNHYYMIFTSILLTQNSEKYRVSKLKENQQQEDSILIGEQRDKKSD